MPASLHKKIPSLSPDDDRRPSQSKQKPHDNPQPPAPAPPRPPLRSNFDLEPNPFEQSFSRGSEPSTTSVATQSTLKNGSSSRSSSPNAPSKANQPAPVATSLAETPKPKLPPLASIASPSDTTYAWGLNSADLAGSLRSGPLSPAMLQGPQQANANNPASNHLPAAASALSLAAFDPAAFGRTGLTPGTGLTPLVGGPVSFPPPSPNTAAFLAMVTNSTTAAALASSTAATITPNTLTAITGVLNTTSMPQDFTQRTDAFQPFNPARPEPFNASTSSDQQVNGLFLLSQAHQELAKREQARRASSVSGQSDNAAPNGAAQTKRGAKRKSIDAPPSAATGPSTRNATKKSKASAPAPKTRKGRRPDSDEDDDLDDDSDAEMAALSGPTPSTGKGSKKPETEEEKRRNFLERNRQAALKCRQRKKQWLTQLQAKVEFLGQENERLQNALMASRDEIQRLTALVGAGAMNMPQQNGGNIAQGQPVAVSSAVGGAARGYGY